MFGFLKRKKKGKGKDMKSEPVNGSRDPLNDTAILTKEAIDSLAELEDVKKSIRENSDRVRRNADSAIKKLEKH